MRQLKRDQLSIDALVSKAVEMRVVPEKIAEARRQPIPAEAVLDCINDKYLLARCALLFQPIEWIRTAVDLAPYKYFVEWMAWASTFALIGDSITGGRRVQCCVAVLSVFVSSV